MTLEPAKPITGGEMLRDILESLRLPIITADGESFTVRRFVFYCIRDNEPSLFDPYALRVEHLQRLGLIPVGFEEKSVVKFPDCIALLIEMCLKMSEASEKK